MTTVKVDMKGIAEAVDALKNLGKAGPRQMERTIRSVTERALELAVEGIKNGPASGVTYWRVPGANYMTIRAGGADGTPVAFVPGGGSHNLSLTHTASAPGEYPMRDTGRLDSMIMTEYETPGTEKITGVVGTNVMHGKYLEFGTSRMAARPWLGRSVNTAASDMSERLLKALEAASK